MRKGQWRTFLTDFEAEIVDQQEMLTQSLLESANQQEVCWHMAQISPRLHLTKSEGKQIIEWLKRPLSHKSKIVRVSAMDAMTCFAERDETMK